MDATMSAEFSTGPGAGRWRALIVDDSAVIRQLLRAILVRGGMEVETAADPLIAQAKMVRFRPDVILLDLEMPRMDGITWLRQLMAENPLPVVICSALTGRFAHAAMRALAIGAVDVITKPKNTKIEACLDDVVRHISWDKVPSLNQVSVRF